VLLLEHASAGLPADLAAPMGEEMRAVAARRGAAIVAATADRAFARAVATRVLTLEPATGQVAEAGVRGWFRRLG
jgi:ABC-type sulfate/molybdate transport systems ATPase subunit